MTKTNIYGKVAVILLLLICTITALLLNIVDPSGHKLEVIDDKIKIKSEIFDIEEIKDIELLDDINIGSRIKGTGTLKYLRGTFKINNGSEVGKVYVYRDKNPYIRIELDDKIIIYNDGNREDTEKTYKKLVNKVEYIKK